MALHFDIDIVRIRRCGSIARRAFTSCCFSATDEGRSQRAFVASCQTDQAGVHIAASHRVVAAPSAFGLLAHFELRDELAEVLIAFAGFTKQRQRGPVLLMC